MDDLKQKAGEQSRQLADKQAEADAALKEITASMQVSDCPRVIENRYFSTNRKRGHCTKVALKSIHLEIHAADSKTTFLHYNKQQYRKVLSNSFALDKFN